MKFGIREMVFVGALVALLGASYFLVFNKANSWRTNRLAQIEAKQKALSDLEQSTAGVRDVDKKINELQAATEFFEKKLPKEKEIDKILKEVWQLAESKNLQIRTIKTLKSERMNGYSEQPIEMALSGDFSGFYDYMLQLEQLPRLTRVTQMTLQKIADHDGEMQAQLTVSIFFEPETESSASAQ